MVGDLLAISNVSWLLVPRRPEFFSTKISILALSGQSVRPFFILSSIVRRMIFIAIRDDAKPRNDKKPPRLLEASCTRGQSRPHLDDPHTRN
jgi:hypothetical protein